MKKALLVYNPVAGKKVFAAKLDSLVGFFQQRGWLLSPYRTSGIGEKGLKEVLDEAAFEAVIVAGGDGSVHHVVNLLLRAGLDIPLGIIPVGTANDFAAHLGLPPEVDECCTIIAEGETTRVDIGWASGSYFVNAASAGLLTDIPHMTDVGMKNVLGKLAYYLKGIEQIPNFRPIGVEIVTRDRLVKEEMLLFLILNGHTAGGFTHLAPRASIEDGAFDVIMVRPCNLGQLLSLFVKLIKGEHINDPRVEYFQASQVIINCSQAIDTDLDGEQGPGFPLEIKVLPQRLPVFTKKFRVRQEKRF